MLIAVQLCHLSAAAYKQLEDLLATIKIKEAEFIVLSSFMIFLRRKYEKFVAENADDLAALQNIRELQKSDVDYVFLNNKVAPK